MDSEPENIPPEIAADCEAEMADAAQKLATAPNAVDKCKLCGAPLGELRFPSPDGGDLEPRYCGSCFATEHAHSSSVGVLPLADLRERLAMCRESLVEEYKDGNVHIKFDVEARRGLLRPMDKKVEW
jgi:hypothetical protein